MEQESQQPENTMEDFHIVWYPKNDSIYSTGMDIRSENMVKALEDFIAEHNITPLYIMSKAALERKVENKSNGEK